LRIRRTVAGTALTALGAGLLATFPLTAAQAVSADLVISQVYGAGGNAGATLNADYIEIFNRGSVPVPLTGLSLQYGSATGTGAMGASTTALTELPDVSIPAGGYFLVEEASGANGADFAADLTDPTPIPMAAAAGKVALVRGTTGLGCNTATTCTDSGAASRIVDLVGYGAANYFEGAGPTPAPSPTAAALRKDNGRAETDDNAADFTTGAPAPRKSGTTPPPVEPDPEALTIAQVQGDGARSPYVGTKVAVEGVVTGDFQEVGQYGGYVVQSLSPDSDDATSDGIRIFDFRTPVAVGEHVRVTGTVFENQSADTDGSPSGTETQLGSGSTVERLGTADLPEPIRLELPFAATQGDVAGQERYEGMRVTLPQGLVATDLFTLGRFGEIGLTSGELLRIPTDAAEDAANDADQILLDDGYSTSNRTSLPYTVDAARTTLPRAGDALTEPVTGVMSFGFGFYRVEPAVDTTALFERRNQRTPAPDPVGGDVQIASFNVLNYFVDFGGDNRGADNPAELARQQAKLVSAITALDADVVGLIEIANDDGDALKTLVAALNDAQADPADDYTAVVAPNLDAQPTTLGGTYGTDAIRTAIIYRAAVVTPAGPPPADKALLNPADPAFPEETLFDRPPAVQSFVPAGGGEEFTVLVNHLKSKGSTNAQCGIPDPIAGNCDDLRERQAAGILDLAEALGAENALLLGDLNSYEEEAPIDVLRAGGYYSAESAMPLEDRYSYSFDGEFGTLDYVFASPALKSAITGIDIWHINSAEAPAYDYNSFNQPSLYDQGPYASSDHDPALVGINLDQPTVADAGGPYKVRVDRNVTLDASGSTDPDTTTLTHAWDLDGDGAFDDATGARVPFGVGKDPGRYTVAVRVSDANSSDIDEAEVAVTTPKGVVPPGRP
jgi:uncharacterized protein